MTARVARRILLLMLALSFVASLAVGLRADTPDWSPVNWGIFFLTFSVFIGGPIALVLEWRATDGWRKPNPHAVERLQIDEPVHAHKPPR